MSTLTNEHVPTDEHASSRDEQPHRYPSTNSSSRHSTPTSSGGERQFHFSNHTTNERGGSGQNSRTSSMAESIDGFSNYGEVIQHLQSVWNNHNNAIEHSRRLANQSGSTSSMNDPNNNDTGPMHHAKGHAQTGYSSQQHYPHHQSGPQQQYWNNYNNPRRSGGAGGHYSRGYVSGNNDPHWNQKTNRFPTHRSMNNLMNNANNNNYPANQQQPSPPTQRRPSDMQQQQQHHHNEQQSSQSYYKKNRSDHDRRPNGYGSQSSDHSSTSHHAINPNVQNLVAPDQSSNINSTQSFPSHSNSYNR